MERLVVVLAMLALACANASEIRFQSQSDTIMGRSWRAEGVEVQWQGDAFSIAIGRLLLPSPLADIRGLQLRCDRLLLAARIMRCPAGRFSVMNLADHAAQGVVRFSYGLDDQSLSFDVSDLAMAGVRGALNGVIDSKGWRATLTGDVADVKTLAPVFKEWGGASVTKLAGKLELQAEMSAIHGGPAEVVFNARSGALTFSASDGRYAAEKLAAQLAGRWRQSGDFQSEVKIEGGQLYLDPLFWEIAKNRAPIVVSARGAHTGERLRIDVLRLRHPGVADAHGALTLNLGKTTTLEALRIDLDEAALPTLYRQYLQPLLANTALADLNLTGTAKGAVEIAQGAIKSVAIAIDNADLRDNAGKFSIQDLHGRLVWGAGVRPQSSRLRWRAANLYRLAIGGGDLALESAQGGLRLAQAARIPLLDGALLVERMEGLKLTAPDWEWRFDGRLQAISMEALSQALDWPKMTGTLAGVIPGVRLTGTRLEMGGALLIKVFDGDVTVANLRMDDPLGVLPRLAADIDLFNLDLLALTRTFDIGRIEGKLNGEIRDLQLEDWRPAAFDARFYTPEGDTSRRRISQRAVENISALGGGVSGALSRGFLGIFKDFRYSRLGIRCRLRNSVCEMGGVEPVPEDRGYYLVQGGGLPRIDVIGYNRWVDWEELLARIQAAAQSQGPVIR